MTRQSKTNQGKGEEKGEARSGRRGKRREGRERRGRGGEEREGELTSRLRSSPSTVHALAHCAAQILHAWLIFGLLLVPLHHCENPASSPSRFTLHLERAFCFILTLPIHHSPLHHAPTHSLREPLFAIYHKNPSPSTPFVSASTERYPYLSQ